MPTSVFLILPFGAFFQVVKPMFSFVLSTLAAINSAAVCPVITSRKLSGQFVLNRCKKIFCGLCSYIIIGTALGVDVGYLLIKSSFAAAYVSDTGKLLFKIIFAENVVGIFQPFIIHCKSFDDVFL